MSINDSDFFDFNTDINANFETRIIKPPKTKELQERYLQYDYAENLATDIDLKENMRYFAFINGSFYFGDFIEALIIKKNLKVKHLLISTLSLCENNIDSLETLLTKGYVDKIDLIVSDYFYSHERGNLIQYAYDRLDIENRFQLAVTRSHCKICTIETEKGNCIILHGSANLRSSGNIEQLIIEENKELHSFIIEHQNQIINKYHTIKPGIRK